MVSSSLSSQEWGRVPASLASCRSFTSPADWALWCGVYVISNQYEVDTVFHWCFTNSIPQPLWGARQHNPASWGSHLSLSGSISTLWGLLSAERAIPALTALPAGCFSLENLQAHSTGKRPQGKPETGLKDCISYLACFHILYLPRLRVP